MAWCEEIYISMGEKVGTAQVTMGGVRSWAGGREGRATAAPAVARGSPVALTACPTTRQ